MPTSGKERDRLRSHRLRENGSICASHACQESQACGFRALIVTPTRELAKQIHTEILLLGGQRRFKTMLLTKANFATLSHETERNDALRHDILITTPQAILRQCF